jgi:hypothetical protein
MSDNPIFAAIEAHRVAWYCLDGAPAVPILRGVILAGGAVFFLVGW